MTKRFYNSFFQIKTNVRAASKVQTSSSSHSWRGSMFHSSHDSRCQATSWLERRHHSPRFRVIPVWRWMQIPVGYKCKYFFAFSKILQIVLSWTHLFSTKQSYCLLAVGSGLSDWNARAGFLICTFGMQVLEVPPPSPSLELQHLLWVKDFYISQW